MAVLDSMGTTLSMGGFEVAQVTSISALNLSTDLSDVTALSSSSGYEVALATLRRSGELVFSVVWDPDSLTHAAGIVGAIGKLGELRQLVVTFANANASTWSILGVVTNVAITSETADVTRADVTLKCSGAGTFVN